MLKVEQWKKTASDSTHFFRSFIEMVNTKKHQVRQPHNLRRRKVIPVQNMYEGNNGADNNVAIHSTASYEKLFLWYIKPTGKSIQLLARNGKTISLIHVDATHKITQYELALFLHV